MPRRLINAEWNPDKSGHSVCMHAILLCLRQVFAENAWLMERIVLHKLSLQNNQQGAVFIMVFMVTRGGAAR